MASTIIRSPAAEQVAAVRGPVERGGSAGLQREHPGLPVLLGVGDEAPGQPGPGPDVGDQQTWRPTAMVRRTWCSSMAAAKAGAAR